jgi:hypothetical protein
MGKLERSVTRFRVRPIADSAAIASKPAGATSNESTVSRPALPTELVSDCRPVEGDALSSR